MQSTVTPQQRFAQIESPKIQRSTFDRSHGFKTTLDSGLLIPVFLEEALPGDTFNVNATLFGRLSTPLKPVMDNIVVDLHFFSVPLRLLWTNWKRFNGEQDNPTDSTSFICPTMTSVAADYTEMTIYDYMGLPTKITGIEHNTFFLRAYNMIYNAWYRDENLQDSVIENIDNGPDATVDYEILPRGVRKDYFTSALPWAQKADPVSIPLGTTAPITYIPATGDNAIIRRSATDATANSIGLSTSAAGAFIDSGAGTGIFLDPNGTLQADLSTATAATINALREAFQVQRMYERDARGGTRYIELIKSHFGVESPDARLQRPEFLGGTSANVNISPIAQNSATGATGTPQGNLSAMGTFNMSGRGFVKSFTEHEVVLGIASVRADLSYQQGLNRSWSRSTRFDFFWPTLAHLGEQAILNKEIYADGSAADDDVFGYQERYAEYRYKPSQITGLFRSNATGTLDVWHLATDFSALPALNAAFITQQPPIARIVAVPSEPEFILDCFFNFKAARPMPTYATPGLIDHF